MKITYYKQGKLDIRRTAISYGKYYLAQEMQTLKAKLMQPDDEALR